jgi:Flp pilus assembly protein TadD
VEKPAPVLSKKEQEAMKAYESATKLFDDHKYAQAASKAQRCIALMPKNAECHRLAGAAVSGLGQFDAAVKHYRRFLALAPEHEQAAQIRRSVTRYEQNKRKQARGQ